ncbi:MAG TPA: hypothetical protein DCF68_01925, partial [Cyanothece sp. UBA12306]|nr:hypothetical protein [Cyanothece sp. UBA12306]
MAIAWGFLSKLGGICLHLFAMLYTIMIRLGRFKIQGQITMKIPNRSLNFPYSNQALGLGLTILAGATVLGSVNPANAAVILSTDFNGRTVSGATASNLNWTTNGVSDPGNLTADFNLFNTPATQNLFAVQRNLHTQETSCKSF